MTRTSDGVLLAFAVVAISSAFVLALLILGLLVAAAQSVWGWAL